MDQIAFAALCQFCADQARAFDPGAWRVQPAIDGKVLSLVAKYLSLTSWYGHEQELEQILNAADLSLQSDSDFHIAARSAGLDLSLLSAGVRHRIATQQRKMMIGDEVFSVDSSNSNFLLQKNL